MTDTRQLLADADRKFDELDFAGAMQDYRTAAMLKPDRVSLSNIGVCQNLERLHFVRDVIREHPTSLEARLIEANLVPSVSKYTEMLELLGDDPKSEMRIRSARFSMAVDARWFTQFEILAEDLLALWRGVESRNYRRALLSSIARICNPAAIPTLEKLAQEDAFGESAQLFFEVKIKELRALLKAHRNVE